MFCKFSRCLRPLCLLVLLLLVFLLLPSSVTLGAELETITKQPVADTYVLSGKPDQPQAMAERLLVGYDQTGGDQIQRALLKFEISTDETPVGSTIESATLWLYLSALTPSDAPMAMTVAHIAPDWQEDVTWTQHLSLAIDENDIATTTVPIRGGWYQWDMHNLLQTWVNSPERGQYLSLVVRGNESIGQHERGFWARECAESKCGVSPGNRPKLTIQFTKPVPPPTPQPAMVVTLQSSFKGDVALDQQLTYTIVYQNNGIAPLQNVRISNNVPADMEVVKLSNNGKNVEGVIHWTIGELEPNGTGSVSYVVKRTQGEGVIVNERATVQWRYQEQTHVQDSNAVFNPSSDSYLPLITR